MTRRGFVLVLDIGTTGARAMLFDAAGQVGGFAYEEYQSLHRAPNVIDHDPVTWLDAVARTVPAALAAARVDGEDVAAVVVTSQRATVMPVDAAGQPLAPAVLWQDKRTRPQCERLAAVIGEEEVYRRTGLRIDPYFSLPKLMWFAEAHPDVYRAAYRFVTVHDLVVHHLTGVFATEYTQASRTMLLDVARLAWDEDLARAAGLPGVPLPEDVRPTGSVAGALTEAAAAQLGLRPGTPVVMAGGDQQCAAVGLGVVAPGLVKVTTGTGSFVVAPVAQPVFDPARRVLLSASALPGQWILEAGIFTTGAVLRWFRDQLGHAEVEAAQAAGADAYDLLTAEAAEAEPGAGGLVWLPHFAGSAAPHWDPEARGVVYGLTLAHTRKDLARAVLEGIAMEIGMNLAVMRTLVGGRLAEVRVSGGMVRSELFNQIQADVYGCAVVPGRLEQATALGAAALAWTAVGVYPDAAEAARRMGGLDEPRRRQPDAGRHAFYRDRMRLHAAVYRALAAYAR
ncbi:FGGY-family carbohydrate kinase [Alicyclobacillus macrosporangiidus]|uniref:Xylulokinase/glycerol kinase n=1 Tax=Alicyclobacillus macrosporangiidus TaxID=392015 RepID=A0A1I7H1U5_9BACL|nr:FGGY-family carbohydrate kinase [Alicyclobacillus macrosporangiidus]SFU54663.1 xylulokinase/glycerol kinase [Alicyclobacillus macrosporangiidus]